MSMLNDWQTRWQLPPEALEELRILLTREAMPETIDGTTPETKVQAEIRVEAATKQCVLWRNNIGTTTDDHGNFFRFGLANDSTKMNKRIKSSDLIGMRKLLITQEMVGQHVAQFVAREVKRGSWKYKATEREIAQLKFLQLVMSYGGDAAFANSVGTL